MSARLHIGQGFTLPLDLATSTQAILARKRSGKSYLASVEAEEMLDAKQQIAVLDPTSAWWGLKSSADGKDPGYPLIIFGGSRQDAPLDFRAGRGMAKALVEHGFSAIFDIGDLHTEEQIQFVFDFSSELLRINRTAIHLFIDEADTFAPQLLESRLQKQCLGTVSRLVKQGGIRGVGVTMITQRSADINKKLLSQVDMITALRMSHPLDIAPVVDWIKANVSVEFAKEVGVALPSLPIGTAFFSSASMGIGKRVEVRHRRTFNSGATPKPGERAEEPKQLAKVDIEKLGQQIAESVKRAREESPEFLLGRIRDLEAQIAQGGTADMGVLEDVQRMEQELAELRPLRDEAEVLRAEAEQSDSNFTSLLDSLEALVQLHRKHDAAPVARPTPLPPAALHQVRLASVGAPVSRAPIAPAEGVNEPQQRILNAMATLWAVRNANVTIEWIACTAGTTPRARGFEENMRQLKNKGLIDGIRLTEQGQNVARAESDPPTFRAVMERIAAMVSTPQADILRALKVTRYAPVTLAYVLGTTERARGFEENTRQLRKRGFITLRGGHYHLIDWLERLP